MGAKVKSAAVIKQRPNVSSVVIEEEVVGINVADVCPVESNAEVVQAVGQDSGYLLFGTPEQLREEEMAWREKLEATTPEQLAKLEAMFVEEERKGTMPLDFSGR